MTTFELLKRESKYNVITYDIVRSVSVEGLNFRITDYTFDSISEATSKFNRLSIMELKFPTKEMTLEEFNNPNIYNLTF